MTDINLKRRELTWLPVSTKSLVVTLPQDQEINHIWHIMIPAKKQTKKGDQTL